MLNSTLSAPHTANLFDSNAKYGDVVSKGDVIGYLETIHSRSAVKASAKRSGRGNTAA